MIKLMPHQIEAHQAILKHKRFLLADEPGVGKTYPAITAWQEAGIEDLLVICPKSITDKWVSELRRFGTPGVSIADTPRPKRILRFQTARVIVMNYDLVRLHVKEIRDRCYEFVIIDEIHKMRNPSQTTRMLALCFGRDQRPTYIVGLTGTPLSRGPEDLYGPLQLLRHYWHSHRQFQSLYLKTIQVPIVTAKGKKVEFKKIVGYTNQLQDLRNKFAACSLRRLRKNVLHLPPDHEEIHRIDLTSREREKYREVVDEARITLDDDLSLAERQIRVKNIFIRAAQVADGFVPDGSGGTIDLKGAKMKYVKDYIEDNRVTGSMLVWSWFLHPLHQLGKLPDSWKIYGAVKNRAEIIDQFRKSQNGLLIAQPATTSEGINLETSALQVFYRPPWTPGELEQAKARLVRFGQNRQVKSVLIAAKDTLDVRIIQKLQSRRRAINEVTEPIGVEMASKRKDEIVAALLGKLG